MSTTRLTEAHRLTQGRLGMRAMARLHTVWALLDPTDLDATVDRWISSSLPIIEAHRAQSAESAGRYMRAFKDTDLGTRAGPIPLELATTIDPAQVATSLLVTGPISIKKATATGSALAAAVDTAEANAVRASMRHVLNGGRATIIDTVAADRQALGWARATSGRPCSFCALLAGRGPVYKGQETADFHAHDGCSCSTQPVYRPGAPWPAGSDRWADMWSQAKQADGDTVSEFRRLVAAV